MSQYCRGVVWICILPAVAAPQVNAPDARKPASVESVAKLRLVERSPPPESPAPAVSVTFESATAVPPTVVPAARSKVGLVPAVKVANVT